MAFTLMTGLAQNPRFSMLCAKLAAYNDGSGNLERFVSAELADNPYVSPAELAEAYAEWSWFKGLQTRAS